MDIAKPKRVTVPEGSIALIVSQQLANELKSLCLLIRRTNRNMPIDKPIHGIASDILLSIMDAKGS